MEPQQASYEFYWLLSTLHPWHRWSIWLCLGWNPLQKLCGKFMTVIVFFHGFICPICLSFPFRLGPGFTFIAPLQAAEDPIVESCRFRGTKRWRFVHTKNLRRNFCKTEEPDPTSDKTSVGRGWFFFNARTVALKRKIWVKNLWDSEDLRLWERFGGCNESRGFWNRIKNIEVQNLDSFEACSVHFYGAICHIQVATSVARARPEPPVIPKSKSWETNWNEDFWYPVEPWESPKYTGYCFCVIN